jgi:uroporphyrinogen decarboxylase
MGKREIIKMVLEGKRPPYVPWSITLTREAREALQGHFGEGDLEQILQNHIVRMGSGMGFL